MDFLPFLLRGAVLLMAGYLLVFFLLKILRIGSPGLHRVACLIVLGLGWFGGGIPVEIPYETVRPEPPEAVVLSPEFPVSVAVPVLAEPPKTPVGFETQPVFDVSDWTAPPDPVPVVIGTETVLFYVWALGLVLVVGRFIFSYMVFLRRLGRTVPAPEAWNASWQAVLDEAGIRVTIPMHVSTAAGPALVRRLRGYLLIVPEDFWHTLGPESRRAVLRHERAHYLRRDALKSFFVRLLVLPQWFHPCAWFAVRRFDEAAEWACDEAACRADDGAVADFASALVRLHEMAPRPVPFNGLAGRKPSGRILRLIQFHQRENRKDSIMKKTIVLTLFLLLAAAGTLKFDFVEISVAETTVPEAATATLGTEEPAKQTFQEVPVPARDDSSREIEMAVLEKLREPFTCNFKEPVTLLEALKEIHKKTKVEVFVDWIALKEKGVDEKTTFKFRLPFAMPLKDALNYLLKQHDLDWVVKNEKLSIVARSKKFIARHYYVSDLLAITPEASNNSAALPKDIFVPIKEYIQTMVDPESWSDSGGSAKIEEYYPNLSLVILQTEQAHDQIEGLLATLHKHAAVRISFIVEMYLLEKDAASKDGKPRVVELNIANGQAGTCRPEADCDYFVKLWPDSGKPSQAAENEPFLFAVPKGKTWSIEGIASQRYGRDIIKATLRIHGKEPEHRIFYASPWIPEEEKAYTPERTKSSKPISLSYGTVICAYGPSLSNCRDSVLSFI